MKLSIVIPVFNEALRLPQSLDRVVAFFREKGIAFEISVGIMAVFRK
jgi:glycosyltransferase involved in cell wall biosynthesis